MLLNMEQVCQHVYPSIRRISHWVLKNAGVLELADMYGRVMELVDMRDSKFLAFGRGGSSPPSATTIKNPTLGRVFKDKILV